MPIAMHEAPAGELRRRLEMIFDWYRGMVSERTGRLAYLYEPERNAAIDDGSPIRDIASVCDMQRLSRFLGRAELAPVIARSLDHYRGYIRERDGHAMLAAGRLGEPSGIAHSAFMILSLLQSAVVGDRAAAVALAAGIAGQQRDDGSYEILFGPHVDSGLDFYPGEAMLALMETYRATRDRRFLDSVERGFVASRLRYDAGAVAPDLRVFHANWQSRYARLLIEETRDAALASRARDFVFALHDRVVGDGFYAGVDRAPRAQATVEVACALEGISAARAVATRARDDRRAAIYEHCARIAVAFLLAAQRLRGGTARERGGFGHSLDDRAQRVDVTGHVASGFIEVARAQEEPYVRGDARADAHAP